MRPLAGCLIALPVAVMSLNSPVEGKDWSAFVTHAIEAHCADTRNDLYVVDDTLVFAAREGQCADAAYAYILYGPTPDKVLCTANDSMGGAEKFCKESKYQGLFDTILGHPTSSSPWAGWTPAPNLGLGSDPALFALNTAPRRGAQGFVASGRRIIGTVSALARV